MIGSFLFNGVDSESFKLVCKSVSRPLLPAVKTRRVELPGISGVYDLDVNGVDYEYEMRTITMKIQYIGTSYQELRTRARSLASWLSTQTWGQLIINDETDKYYLAKVTSGVDMEALYESGSADISFDCQPFAYSVTEEILEFIASDDQLNNGLGEFTNPGTRSINFKSPPGSRLYISIDGVWNATPESPLTIAINDTMIQYTEGAMGILTIDGIEMEVKLDNVNVFNYVMGDVSKFLKIKPGLNEIVVVSSMIAATVTVRYIPLWL